MKRLIASLILAFGLVTVAAPAADEKLSGIPMATESPFVNRVSADLQMRFPTPESARRAGYVRYTDEDNTGAISYANRQWTSIDDAHPSQLWYDVNGRLLGADFSILQADSAAAPQKFGVDPRRWTKFPARNRTKSCKAQTSSAPTHRISSKPESSRASKRFASRSFSRRSGIFRSGYCPTRTARLPI